MKKLILILLFPFLACHNVTPVTDSFQTIVQDSSQEELMKITDCGEMTIKGDSLAIIERLVSALEECCNRNTQPTSKPVRKKPSQKVQDLTIENSSSIDWDKLNTGGITTAVPYRYLPDFTSRGYTDIISTIDTFGVFGCDTTIILNNRIHIRDTGTFYLLQNADGTWIEYEIN